MARSAASTPAGRTRAAAKRSATATPPRPSSKAGTKPKHAAKPKRTAKPKQPAKPKRAPKPKRLARPKRAAKLSAAPKPARKPRSVRAPTRAPRTSARRVAKPARQRRSLPRPTLRGFSWPQRLVLIASLLGVLAAGYMFWLRDSSLVAVTDVEVVGVTAGDRGAIISGLTAAGEEMSTLHVDRDRLTEVATAFPTVKSVAIDPNFPHGLRLEITERPPVMVAASEAGEVAVAADGAILTGVEAPEEGLPELAVEKIPASGRLEGDELAQTQIVGATPEPLRALIEKVEFTKDWGVVVTVRGDIPIRFGGGGDAIAKWKAAAAVLADPKLTGLTYLDVRYPDRPGAGGAAPTA
jgi:cell division protein FtsQ